MVYQSTYGDLLPGGRKVKREERRDDSLVQAEMAANWVGMESNKDYIP